MRGYKSVFDRPLGTFYRKGEGYLDDNNDWKEPVAYSFEVTGDMQPYHLRYSKQMEAPRGFTLTDAKYVSSKHCLKTVNDTEGTGADFTIINGREFYVWAVGDWSGTNLPTSVYKDYILIQKGLNNDGGAY